LQLQGFTVALKKAARAENWELNCSDFPFGKSFWVQNEFPNVLASRSGCRTSSQTFWQLVLDAERVPKRFGNSFWMQNELPNVLGDFFKRLGKTKKVTTLELRDP
jgi:hypothetical protein